MINDNRFKELLNLHLDHRLSVGEARELEQALRADSARLREFRRYAVLQRGCAELFRRSAADAPAPDALVRSLRAAENRMSARSERRLIVRSWGTWGATAGMAAVVALVVARVSQPTIFAVASDEGPVVVPARTPTPVALAASLPSAAPAYAASSRSALPEHLTLAALGIESEQPELASALSRWQSTEDAQLARMENSSTHAGVWMNSASGTTVGWNGSPAAASQFAARPINAWAAQSGYQLQTAGYTFER